MVTQNHMLSPMPHVHYRQKGLLRTRNAAQVFVHLEPSVTTVYSSPRVRALQTAKIMADALDLPVETTDELDFSFNESALMRLLVNAEPDDEYLLVGHNPSFSDVVSMLIGAPIDMRKGQIVRLDYMSNKLTNADLVWMMTARAMNAIVAKDEIL